MATAYTRRGRKLDAAGQFRVLVNQQLAHGLAQRAIKAADPHAVVAIASTGRACYPLEETPEDIAAARAACFSTNGGDWAFTHHWLLDPICFGRYPHCAGDGRGAAGGLRHAGGAGDDARRAGRPGHQHL